MKEHKLSFGRHPASPDDADSVRGACSCGKWYATRRKSLHPNWKKEIDLAHAGHAREKVVSFDDFTLALRAIAARVPERGDWRREGCPTAEEYCLGRYGLTYEEALAAKVEADKKKAEAEAKDPEAKKKVKVAKDKTPKLKNSTAKFRLNKIGEISKGNETMFCHAWFGLPDHTGTLEEIKEVYFIANENARVSSITWFVGRAMERGEAEEVK